MKRVIWLSAAFCVGLGCSGADLSCDDDSFESTCVNANQRYVCTHGEKAIEECATGYQCKEDKTRGAFCQSEGTSSEQTESGASGENTDA